MGLENFTIEQLGYFITMVGGVCVACIAVIIKSRCKTIETPCCKCRREILRDKNETIIKTNSIEKDRLVENEPEVEK